MEKMQEKIKLGYEIGTGEEVVISPSHLIVTGVTQLSGKTTTLEALIKRSGLKAIVFKTKIGEKSFTEGTEIPPFFKDRSDYEFVKSLIEAYSKEKLFLEKGTLMRLCKGSGSLLEIKKKVDEALLGKLRSIEQEIYTRLQHNLENLIPQIQYANLSKVLTVYSGINIMNLERFTEEVQSLIIQSVADEVLKNMKEVIIVIPEAWKFIPQKYNNPCKRVVESFIRQGASNLNFIWIDSQDMAGVDKIPLKQISTWILGYQAERNEVSHTIDQIPLPAKSKPKEEEIMTLRKGHFILSSYDGVKKVYVQPAWLQDLKAKGVALGEISIEEIQKPLSMTPFSLPPIREDKPVIRFDDSQLRKEIVELRGDFFNKIQELQGVISNLYSELQLNKVPVVNIDEIVSKVLQKIPVSTDKGNNIDKEAIIREVISRMPKTSGSVTYEVAPLEKINKDFLQEAKDRIISLIQPLDDEQKKMLKYIESLGIGQKLGTIIEKCLFKSQTSGGTRDNISKKLKNMANAELLRYDAPHSLFYPSLKETIRKYCEQHGITNEEIVQIYNHILLEML